MFVISLQSSEEIDKKYLLKFIITGLKNQNVSLCKNSKFYLSYVKELAIYQVFILKDKAISDIFFYKPKHNLEVLVSEDFFIFYKDYKIYYYQKLSDINIDDIKTYINKNFHLYEIKISFIKDVLIDKKKISYRFQRAYKSNVFKIFIVYLLVLSSFFYFYESKEKSVNFGNFTKNLEQSKRNIEYKYLTKDITKIFNKARQNNIKVSKLEYRASYFSAVFVLNNQQNLNKFFKNLSFYKVERIEQNKDLKALVANVYFKFD